MMCFIYHIKMFFSAKAILEFFKLFYLNFNKLGFKISPKTFKNVDYFESYLEFKKALKL